MEAGIDRRGVLVAAGSMALMSATMPIAAVARPVPPKRADCKELTADAVTEGWDLGGKLALVTGCNSGIGFETMRVLAKRGAHVLGAARTSEKAVKACAQVNGDTTPLPIELTDFGSIDLAAAQVAAMDRPLDMLICNAGVMSPPERTLKREATGGRCRESPSSGTTKPGSSTSIFCES